MSHHDLNHLLRNAATAGTPHPPASLAQSLVARGRRRRRTRRVAGALSGAALGLALILGLGAVAVQEESRPVVGEPPSGNAVVTATPDTAGEVAGTSGADQADTLPSDLTPSDADSAAGSDGPRDENDTAAHGPDSDTQTSGGPATSPSDGAGTTDQTASVVGVTSDTITLFTVADDGGTATGALDVLVPPPPTPSKNPTVQAVQAYLAYVEAEVGLIHGRSLELVVEDTHQSAAGAAQAYDRACSEAFAVVGSGSVHEDAVGTADRCGLPDVRAVSWTGGLGSTTFAVDPRNADVALGHWATWARREPDAIERAGLLYGANEQNRAGTRWVMEATSPLDYTWVVDEAIGATETNFSAYVTQLQRNDVDFVYLHGLAPQSLQRLGMAMEQQDYRPALVTIDRSTYHHPTDASDFPGLEDMEVAIDAVPIAELETTAEGTRYLRWLREVDPDAVPTLDGLHAWSATRLVVAAIADAGPNPTREQLLDRLRTTTGYGAAGLIGQRSIADRGVGVCWAMLSLSRAGWARVGHAPNGSLVCDDRVWVASS